MPKRAKSDVLSVLLFSHSPHLAGAERSLIELVNELVADHNVICTVVSPGYGPLVDAMQAAGASTIIEPRLGWWAFPKGSTAVDLTRETIASGTQALLRLMPKLQALDPDVVYTQTIASPWGASAAALLDKPHVWSICEFGNSHMEFLDAFHEISEQVKSGASLILCNSEAVRSALFPDLSADLVRTIYRHIAIPLESTKPCVKAFPGRAETRLAIFGTLQENKGQLDAIKATAKLVASGRDVELLIAGYALPEYQTKLETLINESKLSVRIRVSEFLPNPYPAMSAADVLLVCSRNEPFGRVAAEGMLLGRPVIFPRSGGIPEYMQDGVTGLSYSPGDIDELTNRIEALIDDPVRASRLGAEAKRYATAKFTRDAYGGEIFRILQHLRVAGHRRVAVPRQVVSAMATAALSYSDRVDELNRELQMRSAEIIRSDEQLTTVKGQRDECAAALEARSAEVDQVSDDLRAVKRHNENLTAELAVRSAEIAELRDRLEAAAETNRTQTARHNTDLANSHDQINELKNMLERRSRELRLLRASRSWRVTRAFRDARRFLALCYSRIGYPLMAAQRALMTCSDSPLRELRAVHIISSSGFFDRQWYLNSYPDVAASGMDPIRHYLHFGAKEGRDPSPTFSTCGYLSQNPDVAAAEGNPLVHFVLHGAAEGRARSCK
jgi:glycosyltransferase involved in cell wall biosynthesis